MKALNKCIFSKCYFSSPSTRVIHTTLSLIVWHKHYTQCQRWSWRLRLLWLPKTGYNRAWRCHEFSTCEVQIYWRKKCHRKWAAKMWNGFRCDGAPHYIWYVRTHISHVWYFHHPISSMEQNSFFCRWESVSPRPGLK